MPQTKGEQVLKALEAALATLITPTREVVRNSTETERIPDAGLIVLRDGDPGEPESNLGNQGPYYYQHAAEIELYLEEGDAAAREMRFDALRAAVGQALDADPTLGGEIFGMTYAAPEVDPEAVFGGEAIKAAVLTVTLDYESATRI